MTQLKPNDAVHLAGATDNRMSLLLSTIPPKKPCAQQWKHTEKNNAKNWKDNILKIQFGGMGLKPFHNFKFPSSVSQHIPFQFQASKN